MIPAPDAPDPTVPGTVADLIPRKLRRVVYLILSAAFTLELVWDAVPEVLEGKLLKSLGALGLGMAGIYSGKRPAAPTTTGQEAPQ